MGEAVFGCVGGRTIVGGGNTTVVEIPLIDGVGRKPCLIKKEIGR